MTEPFTKHSEKVIHDNGFFRILERVYRLPNGKEHRYFIQDEVDSCCVLARTTEGKFIAVQEFRVGPEQVMTELPAGRLEGRSDNPDRRIKQELLEETGYLGVLKKVGVLPSSPYSNKWIHCYYAIDCKKVGLQRLDANEFIEVKLFSKEEMYEILISGKSSSCSPGLLAWEWMRRDATL